MIRKIALIEWIDASMYGTDTFEADKKFGLTHGFACGIIISEDKDKIVIATDYFDSEYDHYRGVNVYPKTGIKKIKYYKFNLSPIK